MERRAAKGGEGCRLGSIGRWVNCSRAGAGAPDKQAGQQRPLLRAMASYGRRVPLSVLADRFGRVRDPWRAEGTNDETHVEAGNARQGVTGKAHTHEQVN